jgi:hypothetical protein
MNFVMKRVTYPFECLLHDLFADAVVPQVDETGAFEAVDNLTGSFASLGE